MKVTAVTPAATASDPNHPDHERWVKEHTLKMEVEHAQAVGLSLRDAEAENVRMLERSAQIAKAKPQKPKNVGHQERKAHRGVTTRSVSAKEEKPKGCKCGLCNACKRAQRISLIMQMGRQNSVLGDLAKKLMVVSLQASSGTGQFLGLNKRDCARALHTYVDAACDASVPVLGRWR